MRKMPILLTATLLALGQPPAAFAAAWNQPETPQPEPVPDQVAPNQPAPDPPFVIQPIPNQPEPCGAEADIQPQSAIRDRYAGADAGAFLLGIGAVDDATRLPPTVAVVVLSGDDVFGGNAAFIATGACFRGGPLFFDPVRYRLGRSLVARRHAGLPIRLAALEPLAAKGDAEAQLLAGSRHEIAVPGSGRTLLESSARQGQALAMLELGYVVSGLDQIVVEEPGGAPVPLPGTEMVPVGPENPPVRFQLTGPGMDRPIGYCWLKAAVAGGDSGIAALGTTWLGALTQRMTEPERDAARAMWDRNADAVPAEMCR